MLDGGGQIEMSETSDSTALLVDNTSEGKQEDESLEAETTIDDESHGKSEMRTLKFESEPGSLLSSSQKKSLFFQRLLLLLAGVVIVVGAGIASDFKPYQDSNDCGPVSDTNSTYSYVSNCSGVPCATSVLLNITSTSGILRVTSLQCFFPALSSTSTVHQVCTQIVATDAVVLSLLASLVKQ